MRVCGHHALLVPYALSLCATVAAVATNRNDGDNVLPQSTAALPSADPIESASAMVKFSKPKQLSTRQSSRGIRKGQKKMPKDPEKWYDPKLLTFYDEGELYDMYTCFDTDTRLEKFKTDNRIYVYKSSRGILVPDRHERTFADVYEHRRATRYPHKFKSVGTAKTGLETTNLGVENRGKKKKIRIPERPPGELIPKKYRERRPSQQLWYDPALLEHYTEDELFAMYNLDPFYRTTHFPRDKIAVQKSNIGKLIPDINGRTNGDIVDMRQARRRENRKKLRLQFSLMRSPEALQNHPAIKETLEKAAEKSHNLKDERATSRRQRLYIESQHLSGALSSEQGQLQGGESAQGNTMATEELLNRQSDNPTALELRLQAAINGDPNAPYEVKARHPDRSIKGKPIFKYVKVPNPDGWTNAEYLAWLFYKRKITHVQMFRYLANHGFTRLGIHPYREGHDDPDTHGVDGLTVVDTTNGIVRIHQEPLKPRARMIKATRTSSVPNNEPHSIYDQDQISTPAISDVAIPSSPNVPHSNFIEHYDPGSRIAFGGFPWSHLSANENIQTARAGNGQAESSHMGSGPSATQSTPPTTPITSEVASPSWNRGSQTLQATAYDFPFSPKLPASPGGGGAGFNWQLHGDPNWPFSPPLHLPWSNH